MSNNNKPRPDTTTALLESGGYTHKRATVHTYVDTRECEVEVPRTEGTAKQPAWEFIFKCNETGVERRWGIVDRLVFKNLLNEEGVN